MNRTPDLSARFGRKSASGPVLLGVVWTILIAGFLGISYGHDRREAEDLAWNTALSNFNKDMAIRLWATTHGGVYVPSDERTPPNPALAHIPERDIQTPSGKQLTLMNPAYLVRQLMEEYGDLYGVRGRITSLKPLRAENAPDDWERRALLSFDAGASEAREYTEVDGQRYLRFMQPLVTTEGCLKCHGFQGYEVGQVRGGVGVAVEMAPLYARATERSLARLLPLSLIWLFGCAGIGFGAVRLRRRDRQTLQAVEELERARAFQQTVLDEVPEMVMVIGRDYRVRLANQAVHDFYGADPCSGGLSCYQVAHGKEAPCVHVECPLAAVLETGGGVTTVHVQHDREGRERTLEVKAAPLHDDEGEIDGIVEACRDITARVEAEEERLHLERQMLHGQKLESLGVLAGGIAHDFNNLLMAILGNADLAIADPVTPPETLARLKEIEAASQRAAGLAAQMLAYSGKGSFLIEPIDLGDVVRELGQILAVTISKKAEVRLELADEIPPFQGDVAQVQQVVMNLITNASEALGDEEGSITVSTGWGDFDAEYLARTSSGQLETQTLRPEPGRFVFVKVADTGCGMNQVTRDRLFDPFYSTKFTGRGLGMAAVLGIVRGHRGAVHLYTEPGEGTVVQVMFPAGAAGSAGAGPRSAEPLTVAAEQPAPEAAAGLVLIADDEPSVRELGQEMLEQAGYEVVTAVDGEDALRVFAQRGEEIDCVLLDLTMPKLGGEEVFQRLVEQRPGIRVLLSSGFTEVDAQERFAEQAPAGFIQKPYRSRELVEAVRRVLRPS